MVAVNRDRDLRALADALRELLALLSRDPDESWSKHFAPLLERVEELASGEPSQAELTRLSTEITSYFVPKDSGFDAWLASSPRVGMEESARRVDAAALALRVVGEY